MFDKLSSSNTVLLVVDKQLSYTGDNQVIERLRGSTQPNAFTDILPKIDNFIEKCRAKNVEVVWAKMIEDPELSPPNIATKMRLTDTPSISNPSHPDFEFNGLAPNPDEKVITKKYYDAFAQTDLSAYLQSKGIENVIIVGGYASRCILATTFGANGYGYNVVIVKELVANPASTADEVPFALNIIDSILGYVVDEKDLVIT